MPPSGFEQVNAMSNLSGVLVGTRSHRQRWGSDLVIGLGQGSRERSQ